MEKREYRGQAEEAIVLRAQNGEGDAEEFLLQTYKELVLRKARTLYLTCGDKDDLIQEGMIGLYKAIRNYTPERGAAFATFAELCIERQMYNAVNAANRKKNQPMNDYISLDSTEYLQREEQYYTADGQPGDPEMQWIARESADRMERKLMARLSVLEKEVLGYYLQGMPYTEIAKTLRREPKSVDNAIQRIRAKMRQIANQMRTEG